MNYEEFENWIRLEVFEGRLLPHQAADLLIQRQLFDENRSWMQKEFLMKVVGFVASERHANPTVSGLVALAQQKYPRRMLYFEPIGFEFR